MLLLLTMMDEREGYYVDCFFLYWFCVFFRPSLSFSLASFPLKDSQQSITASLVTLKAQRSLII